MAGASTVELAATISGLGGLGSLPLGSLSDSPSSIESQVNKFRGLVDGSKKSVVNLNFFAHDEPLETRAKLNGPWLSKYSSLHESAGISAPKATELKLLYPTFKSIIESCHPTVKLLQKLQPKVVSFHFGLPAQSVLDALQASGIKLFVSITNLTELQLCLNAGVDGVVLQGWEAGGHRGNFVANDASDEKLSALDLVRLVVEYIDAHDIESPPFVIAAGGIYDSQGVKELLSYNIAGVQVGTVLLPTDEATISAAHLDKFQNPTDGTLMTASISGRNLRTISTEFLERLHISSPVDQIPEYPLPYDAFKSLVSEAAKDGKGSQYAAFLSGSNYDKSWKNTRSVEKVFASLVVDV